MFVLGLSPNRVCIQFMEGRWWIDPIVLIREGGLEKMLARLNDPATRERIKRDMDDATATTWENQWYGSGGGDGVMVSSVLDPSLR